MAAPARHPGKPRVKKLRLLLILFGLGHPRGHLDRVRDDDGGRLGPAPDREPSAVPRRPLNSYLYDDHWHLIGLFAPPNHEVIDQFDQISWGMRRAIVAVEDRRFWSDPGVDLRGIARAVVADVTGGSRQGASTIAQQFVKNALSEQDNRTVFEKLREAALAYHLTRRWPKKKIIDGVPELDLLRQRRLRRRIRRARVLRQGARLRLGRRTRADELGLRRRPASLVRLDAHPARGGAAGRDGGRSERVRPAGPPAAA